MTDTTSASNNVIAAGAAPVAYGVKGIGPNSGVPIRKPLKGLTRDDRKCAILSNFFIVPEVTINTVIWEHWEAFSRSKYIWKVVLSRPDCVKMFLLDCRCFLCMPHATKAEKYKAIILSRFGNVTKTLLASGTLEEALAVCEDEADEIRFNVSQDIFSRVLVHKSCLSMTPENPEGYFLEVNELTNAMPLKTPRLKGYNYFFEVLDQLEDDGENKSETLEYILNAGAYSLEFMDILSKKEVQEIYSRNINGTLKVKIPRKRKK